MMSPSAPGARQRLPPDPRHVEEGAVHEEPEHDRARQHDPEQRSEGLGIRAGGGQRGLPALTAGKKESRQNGER